jgi:hypothetical protein
MNELQTVERKQNHRKTYLLNGRLVVCIIWVGLGMF